MSRGRWVAIGAVAACGLVGWAATAPDRVRAAAARRLSTAITDAGGVVLAEAHQVGNLEGNAGCAAEVALAVRGLDPSALGSAPGLTVLCADPSGLTGWWLADPPGCHPLVPAGTSWGVDRVGLDLGMAGVDHDELAALARSAGATAVVWWRGPADGPLTALDPRCD